MKDFSTLLNITIPTKKRTKIIEALINKSKPVKIPFPKYAYLKHSNIEESGFIFPKNLNFSGSTELGYTTGVMYINN